MSGFVVWFTGLSGAGKSTLGAMLAAELRHRGVHVEVLDGDEVRTHLSKGLTFSKDDRDVNVRRIGFVAKLVARSGACAITAAISPYRAIRDEQRAQIGRFVEVYVQCSIPVLAERDAKGLYKKALAGEIKHFTGIDDPYEAPEQPDVVVDTAVETKEQSLAKIIDRLEALGYVTAAAGRHAGRALTPPHGGDSIDRFVRGAAGEALAERAKGLVAIDLDERAERDLDRIAAGVYAPLKGFMGPKDYLRVVREMRLENGLLWPTPVTLSIAAERAPLVAVGSQAALRARDGRLVGVIDVTDQWTPSELGTVCVGGEVHVLERGAPVSPAHHHDPRDSRAIFTQRGWSRVVAYAACGPMLRAHEHLTKAALEGCDGLFLQAVPAGDLPIALRCHEALIERYYPKDRVLLSIHPGHPGVASASDTRALLLAALVAKNYGASHVIFDHAPAASTAFASFGAGELGIEPLFFEDAFHSTITGDMATSKTAPGDASTRIASSLAEIVDRISRSELPAKELVRPEVAAILSASRSA
ncbi:Adenylylsulfate kinase [Minicystis rosea]|nr:Adenylylsulfate kinase [Minicystis rosea]